MTTMDDLAAWLEQVLIEDKARLSEPTFCGPVWPTTDQMLARIEADRQILAEHEVAWNVEVCTVCHRAGDEGDTLEQEPWPCRTVRLLALPHAGRPGYQEEWRP